MRFINYARVSTDEQAERGYSVPTQLRANCEYVAAVGGELVGDSYFDSHTGLRVTQRGGIWHFADAERAARLSERERQNPINPVPAYVDDYSGATPIEQRPEGKKVYAMLSSGRADALIAYTVDRLVRPPEEGDEWEMPMLIRGLAKLGKEIHTVNRGKLETSFAGLLIAMLDAKGAGDERRKIIERTCRGRNGKAKAGKVVGQGFSPYGYGYTLDHNNKVVGLQIEEHEAAIIRMIYQWFVYGDETLNPLTERRIARKLSESGFPTPSERHANGRKSASGIWNPATVHLILTNETYAGVWRYGKRSGKGTTTWKANPQAVAVQVPAIVSRKLWHAAQERAQANKQNSPRHSKHLFLLRALIRCSCGGTMSGAHDKRRNYHVYRCGLRYMRFSGLDPNRCTEKDVRGDWLEWYVWEYVRGVIINAENFDEELRKAQQLEAASFEPKQRELEALQGLIAESEVRAKQLAAAWASAPEGIVKDALYADIQQFEMLYRQQLKRRGELEAELSKRQFTDEAIASAHQFREDLMLGLENPTFEDIRRALELLKVSIKVHNKTATVTCRIPTRIEAEPYIAEPYIIVLNGSRTNSFPRICIFRCRPILNR